MNAKKFRLNKRRDIPYIVALAAFAAFALLIVLLSTVDVRTATNGGRIGFGGMNIAASLAIGYDDEWYNISQILGYATLAVAAFNVLVAVWQYYKRKKVIAVDKEILCLCALYVAVAILYVAFDVFAVNYRPTSPSGSLEPSFPSSHTLLAFTVLGSSAVVALRRIKNKPLKIAVVSVESAVAVVLVVARTLSGVHWLTDIIGSVILSLALVSCFTGVLGAFDSDEEVRNRENAGA